jgi:hypothetical protein
LAVDLEVLDRLSVLRRDIAQQIDPGRTASALKSDAESHA